MIDGTVAPSVSRRPTRFLIAASLLGCALVVMALASVAIGAVPMTPAHVVAILWGAIRHAIPQDAARDAVILLQIRLPRTILGALVGSALAVSGALLQGLFRNPLADPGLVGVSAGAGLAAATAIVVGDRWLPDVMAYTAFALPCAAFLGGLAATLLLYGFATRGGRTSVSTLLLAGIALGALANAATGLLVFTSNDRELRDLTFWLLGSLGGATWSKAIAAGIAIAPLLLALPFLGRSLNVLALGEAEAFHLGIPVQRTKRLMIALVSLSVGSSVALAGPIAFVGIVVPHLLRLGVGADNRFLLPASAVLGGVLLVAADILARTIAAPADIPIGILTAAIGAPFFLWLLTSRWRDLGA